VPIRPFLSGQTFDPETARLLGVAFEMARAAIKCPRDPSDEIIARSSSLRKLASAMSKFCVRPR
jgi:hypothetical protein